MKIKNIISIIFSSIIFFGYAKPVYAGLGISPSQFISPNLSKGSHVEKIFVLSSSDPKVDLKFSIALEGDTKDWITVDKEKEFIMPKGVQRFPITVYVDIPKNIEYGKYKGGIRLISTSTLSATGSIGVSTALSSYIPIDLTITSNPILEYEVTSIDVQNVEKGSPLKIYLTINNTGNVAARPSKVHVALYDKINSTLLESGNIFELGLVKPLSIDDLIIKIPFDGELGQYWARISVYKDNLVIKNQELVFEVINPSPPQQINEIFENTSVNNADSGYVLAANTSIFITIISLIILFIIIVAIVYFIIIKIEKR